MTSAAAEAVPMNHCAHHPEVAARGPCARCGDFLCEACVETVAGDALVCGACSQHVRVSSPLPWDRAATLATFFGSIRLVVAEPRTTFPQMDPEPKERALWFAVLCWYVPALVGLIERFIAGRLSSVHELGVAAATLVGPLFQGYLGTYAIAGLVFAVARIVGGTGRFSTDLRAVAYATAFYAAADVLTRALPLGDWYPWLDLLVGAWVGWLLTMAVTAHHRVPRARAVVAGYAPQLLLGVLLLLARLLLGDMGSQ